MITHRDQGRLFAPCLTLITALIALPIDNALAADECGIGSVVTCTSADPVNPNGITYNDALVGQSVTFGSGVAVHTTAEYVHGLSVWNASGLVTIDTSAGTITTGGDYAYGLTSWTTSDNLNITTGSITTSGISAYGLFAYNSGSGSTLIDTIAGTISTGGAGANGIHVFNGPQSGELNIYAGTVTTAGDNANGLAAFNRGTAATLIDATAGSISTRGKGAIGINVEGGSGTLSVTTGNVTTSGENGAYGVYAIGGGGSVLINTTAGAITTSGISSYGVYSSTGSGPLTITTRNVTTSGDYAYGVYGYAYGAAPISIDTTAGSIGTGGDGAIGIYGYVSSGELSVRTGDVTTSGENAAAVSAAGNGPVAIDTRAGTITTTGGASYGIQAESSGGSLTVLTGSVSTSGDYAHGVLANNSDASPTLIDTTAGTIATSGSRASGIDATASTGELIIHTGNVSTSGDSGYAVLGGGYGPVSIDTRAGVIMATGQFAVGVLAQSFSFGSGPVTVRTGDVSTAGTGGLGVYGLNQGTGPTVIDTTAGSVTTAGRTAIGVGAENLADRAISIATGPVTTQGVSAPGVLSLGGGAATIDTTAGPISTAGAGSAGVFAISTFPTYVATIKTGSISTSGLGAFGVAAGALSDPTGTTSASGAITVTNTAAITASGADAGGIVAASYASAGATSGPVTVNANGNIAATGQNAVGVNAVSGTGLVAINVASGVSVLGGWSASTGDLSTQSAQASGIYAGSAFIGANLPAAGIAIFSGATSTSPAMAVSNQGTIGALNDRAITMGFACATFQDSTSLPCLSGSVPAVGSLQVANAGTVAGYVTLWSGAPHTFNNAGLFDVRNFADTDGDGVRDTKAVSISDFGGPNATFDNLSGGVVRLAAVTSNSITNTTGQYVPTTGIDSRALEADFYSIAKPGAAQGQFVNLQTFDNAGTVDLRGPTIGNTFVMTSNPTVGGTPGTGVFVSDGGQLLVNTTLNAGIPQGGQTASYSDTLIVDTTRVGARGATSIGVSYDAATAGALTTGDGIELVEVRNKDAGQSAAGAFSLGNRVAGSAYEYLLYQNGVGGDAVDGNWYLRSHIIPVTPSDPELPDYRVEVPVDMAVPALANRFGLAMLGTYHDRVGEDLPDMGAGGRVHEIWCNDTSRNFRCGTTAERRAAWGRVFGETGRVGYAGRGDLGRLGSFEAHGPSYSFDLSGFQAGLDLYRKEHADGARDVAGLYVGAGRIEGDVQAVYGGKAGTASMNGYSLGGYWTHTGLSGWYLDAVLQSTWYDSIRANSVRGESLSSKGWGGAASLEAGYPLKLSDGWMIEPQAQLIYQRVSLDGGADRFGMVDYDDTNAVYGRLGGRLVKTWATDDGRPIITWARANIWHSFGAQATTTFANLAGGNPVALNTDLGGSWGQVGLGVSGQVARNVSVFATADYNFALGSGRGQSVGGRAGLKVAW